MNARKVAAQFAAYTWFENNQPEGRSPAEAAQFALANWTAFLPVANEGWGRLLLRIASQGDKEGYQQRSGCHRPQRIAVAG
jgi:hypothetical protein